MRTRVLDESIKKLGVLVHHHQWLKDFNKGISRMMVLAQRFFLVMNFNQVLDIEVGDPVRNKSCDNYTLIPESFHRLAPIIVTKGPQKGKCPTIICIGRLFFHLLLRQNHLFHRFNFYFSKVLHFIFVNSSIFDLVHNDYPAFL